MYGDTVHLTVWLVAFQKAFITFEDPDASEQGAIVKGDKGVTLQTSSGGK